MVDLKSQYLKIKTQIDREVLDTISSTKYINGPKVHEFSSNLSKSISFVLRSRNRNFFVNDRYLSEIGTFGIRIFS